MILKTKEMIINFGKARNLKQFFTVPCDLNIGEMVVGHYRGSILTVQKAKNGKEYNQNKIVLYSPEDSKFYSIYSSFALDDFLQLVSYNQLIGIYRAKDNEKGYKVLKLYIKGESFDGAGLENQISTDNKEPDSLPI